MKYSLLSAILLFFLSTEFQSEAKKWQDEWDIPNGYALSIDTEGFNFPSAIAFVPKPGPHPKSPLYFVTEMRGKVKVVTRDRSIYTFAEVPFDMTPAKELPDLEGEAGMAGIALDPVHGYVFVSLAYYDTNQVLRNAMVRFDSKPETFSVKATNSTPFSYLFRNDVSILTHQAGAIIIEGNTLYVGIGDGGQHHRTQSLDSTLGKILRMSLDFKPLADNPFAEDSSEDDPRNYVWALGLRNPFGLCRVQNRMFVSENGFMIDRFLEVRRAENCGWNGTDWSIGMNAAMVIGPSVSPVQIDWLQKESTVFPEECRSKFFVALAGGTKRATGVLMVDYDFKNSRLAAPPKQFILHLGEDHPGVYPVGLAFGPDALYIVSLYSVREKGYGKGEVLRLAYDPASTSTPIAATKRAEIIMQEKGCYSCHGARATDLNVAPALDRETLIPRIMTRLQSPNYPKSVARVDALNAEPFASYRQARHEVLKKSGTEQVRAWIKYHVMEPQFDRVGSSMPNLGLKESEAQEISNHLVERNIGDVGVSGFFRSIFHPYIYGPVKRRHLPGAFAMGAVAVLGILGIRRSFRSIFKRTASSSQPPTDPANEGLSGHLGSIRKSQTQ